MAERTPRQNPLTVLRDRQYRLLFIGTTLSMVAFGMMQVVQGIVAFDLTGKNGAVGFVYLGQGISMLVLSPVGGTLSDRISKKKLLTAAQFVIGAMFGFIAFMIATDWLTIGILATCSLILGCMYSMMGPTRQAWVGDILSGPDLAKGVALQQMMMNTTRIAGPLIAGALIAAKPIGAAGTYTTMGLLFAAVVVILTRMDATPPRPRERATSVRADLAEGFHYIWSTPDVRLLAVVFAGTVLFGFTYMTIMPGYLENTLDTRTELLGALYSTTAVGGIVVTLALASWRVSNPVAVMLVFGAAFACSLSLLAISPTFGAALAASAVVGATSSGFQMLNNVNLMERTDPYYFGRVMSVTMMAFGLNSIFSFPVGLLADAIGERATLAGLSGASLCVVVLGMVALRSMPERQPAPHQVDSGIAASGGK